MIFFFGVIAPGKTNVNIPFVYSTAFKEKINEVPYSLYIVGDAAYIIWADINPVGRRLTIGSSEYCVQLLFEPGTYLCRNGCW